MFWLNSIDKKIIMGELIDFRNIYIYICTYVSNKPGFYFLLSFYIRQMDFGNRNYVTLI